MIIRPNNKYQLKVELENFLINKLDCEKYLADNLDLPGFVKCYAFGKFVEIVFHPPDEITDEYVFEQVRTTLREIGIEFVKAILRQYVGNFARTLVASATGGAVGLRAGPAGALVVLLVGALIEKTLFDWKDMCECTYDEFDNLLIRRSM